MKMHNVVAGFVLSLGFGLLSIGCMAEAEPPEEEIRAADMGTDSSRVPSDQVAVEPVDSIDSIERSERTAKKCDDEAALEGMAEGSGMTLLSEEDRASGARSSGGTPSFANFFCPFGCGSVNCWPHQCVNVAFMSCTCK